MLPPATTAKGQYEYMIKVLNKIKAWLQPQQVITRLRQVIINFAIPKQQVDVIEKIAFLENRITSIEKANLIILTRLLQAGALAKPNNISDKIANKSEFLIVSHKDLNAGKTPTYH